MLTEQRMLFIVGAVAVWRAMQKMRARAMLASGDVCDARDGAVVSRAWRELTSYVRSSSLLWR